MTIAFFTKLRGPLQVSVRNFTQRLDYHLVPQGGLEPPRLSTLGFESSASTKFRHQGMCCNQYQNCREAADPLHTHTIMDPGGRSVYHYRESERCTIPSTNRYFVGLFCASRGELNPSLLLGALP